MKNIIIVLVKERKWPNMKKKIKKKNQFVQNNKNKYLYWMINVAQILFIHKMNNNKKEINKNKIFFFKYICIKMIEC